MHVYVLYDITKMKKKKKHHILKTIVALRFIVSLMCASVRVCDDDDDGGGCWLVGRSCVFVCVCVGCAEHIARPQQTIMQCGICKLWIL